MNKIVILGAGVAGMSAAKTLVQAGMSPLIFERKTIPGGRAFSFHDRISSETINNGEHVMIGAYERFFDLLKFIGSYGELESQKALRAIYYDKNQNKYELDTGAAPGKLGKALGLMRFKALSPGDKFRAVAFIQKLKYLKSKCNNQSAFEVLRNNYQTERLVRLLWEPIILATMNATPELADASLFLEVADVVFNGSSFASKIFFPKKNISALFEQFEDKISRLGAKIRFNSHVVAINKLSTISYELVLSDGSIIETENIISTLPPYALNKIYANAVAPEFINKLSYSTIISAYLWYDRKLSDEKFIGLLDSKTHWLFRRMEEKSGLTFPERIATTISAAGEIETMAREEIISLIDFEIKRNLPGAANANLLHSQLLVDKRATPLITPELNRLRPGVRVSENFFIAGDWTSTGLPATLEGAALSGVLAAEEFIDSI